MAVELVTIMNFIFALIIFILGIWVYRVKKIVLALYIAITFGLFDISHLAMLLGANSSDIWIIIIRALGYLVIIFGLCQIALQKNSSVM